MKRNTILAIMAACSAICFAQTQRMTIDRALDTCTSFLAMNMPRGIKVAAPHISAPSDSISRYLTDKLTLRLIHDTAFIVVQHNIKLTGVVSDEIILSMSKCLDVKLIITGELSRHENGERLTIRALDIESGDILCQWQEDLL